jgi:hypothetical protein
LFGPARRLELEAAGASPVTVGQVMPWRQQPTGPRGLVDRLGDRLTPLLGTGYSTNS